MTKKITVILFLSTIYLLSIFNILSPTKSFSSYENRGLQQFPNLTFSSLTSGTFSNQFEDFSTDQFIARNFFVSLKTGVEILSGKIENHQVYFGNDEWLIGRLFLYNELQSQRNLESISSFILNTDIPTHVMIVPSTAGVMEQQLPRFAYDMNQAKFFNLLNEAFNDSYVDVYSSLVTHQTEPIYFKTDHHWSAHGAYYGYQALAKKNNWEIPSNNQFQVETMSTNFRGTMFSRSGMFWHLGENLDRYYAPENDEVLFLHDGAYSTSLYFPNALDTHDQYTYFLGGNYAFAQISTSNRNQPRLLVAKDSFANVLIPFLIPHYSEIYIVDLRFNQQLLSNLVNEHQIDEVLIIYSIEQFLNEPSLNFIR